MSKIGNKAIEIPATVNVSLNGNLIEIKGANGTLTVPFSDSLQVEKENNVITVKRKSESKKIKSLHGLTRSTIMNAIIGVEKKWEKRLEIVGTGYNVKQQGEDIVFKVGYSHPVIFKKVDGVTFKVEGTNKVIVSGNDKQFVGAIAYQMKIIKKT